MSKARNLMWILEEIIEKENKLDCGVSAWNNEDNDPCDMASCDPSDQFLLGEEIEALWKDIKHLVNEE